MAFEKVSYKDPKVIQLAEAMEAKYGLPDGLLVNVITKGEKTDHDRVSKDGARGVAQVIPSTRRGVLEQIGIDAFSSLENNVEAAAYVLRQNLDSAKGDVPEAVARYHAGTGGARGPVNSAYVARVTGKGGGSFSDRVAAARSQPAADEGPSIGKTYEAYTSGKMTPEDARAFEQAVSTGHIILPTGAKVRAARPVLDMPAAAVEAYNSHSDMSDAERNELDRAIKAGEVRPPQGLALKRPDPRTAADQLGMGVRNVLEGGGSLVDVVGAPLNATVNAVAGTNLSTQPGRDLGAAASDALNLAKPGTPGEKLIGSVIEGGTQGLLTAGAALPLAGARGATGIVAKNLAAAPLVDTVSSGAATGAQEIARQNDVGPGGQLAAAILAGGATAAGASGVARKLAPAIAERIGPKAVKVIEDTPPEVLVDEAGELTEEGVEAAVRAKAQPEEFKAAVADLRAATNDNATQARTADQYPPQDMAVGQSEVDTITPRRRGSQQPPEDIPPVREPGVAPAPVQAAPEAPAPPSGAAAARLADAESLGVPLTRGQATQDFGAQADEQALLAAASPEGQAARDFKVKQQEALQGATARFQETLGDAALTPEERGTALKGALEAMRDQGKAGVTALYKAARDAVESLGEQLGDNAKAVLDLPDAGIKARVREILLDDTVDDAVRTGLRQQAAKYGLIGENPRTFEDGTTSVTIKAPGGTETRSITFDGAPEPLSVLNAEAFRKKLNGLYAKDTSGALGSLKGLIDDAVTEAVEAAAKTFDQTPGNVGEQFKAARAAHQQQQRTFNSKDVVAKLLEVKRGGNDTPAVPASRAVKTLLDGPIEDLRKAKAIILSSADPAVKAGWEGVRAQAIADLFGKAWTTNANAGGGMIGQLSGAKLRSEIARVGAPKLKVILGDEDFNQLMKIQRVAGDATIPISGTVNSSGTAGALLRFFGKQAGRLSPLMSAVPGVGMVKAVADVGANVVSGAKEAAKAKSTLEGVQNFTPEAAQAVDAAALAPEKAKANPVQFISDYLAAAKSDRLIAPLVATSAPEADD